MIKKWAKRTFRRYRVVISWIHALRLRRHGVVVGSGCLFFGSPIVRNRGSIQIGEGAVLRSSRMANLSSLGTKLILDVRNGGSISIGPRTGLSNCILISRAHIEIGEGTFIGADAKIFDNDFHSLNPENRRHWAERDIISRPILIGKRCFIGGGAIILKGAVIGDEAVIGAGAVVSGTVGPREIWAGNPAKKVKDLDF